MEVGPGGPAGRAGPKFLVPADQVWLTIIDGGHCGIQKAAGLAFEKGKSDDLSSASSSHLASHATLVQIREAINCQNPPHEYEE